MDGESLIHFFGGAAGGTVGSALTCPFEVIKTRLQSSEGCSVNPNRNMPSTSSSSKQTQQRSSGIRRIVPQFYTTESRLCTSSNLVVNQLITNRRFCSSSPLRPKIGHVFAMFRDIVRTEGYGALYKGLLPNLVGVAPSKAVYFCTYSTLKRVLNDGYDFFEPNSAIVHLCSAAAGGFVAASVVNPIWLVKTRLQLYHGPMTVVECIRKVYRNEGLLGFYKGVNASYVGITETIIQFVIYEYVRSLMVGKEDFRTLETAKRNTTDFISFMFIGASAKLIAVLSTYPHEVVRTRLREESSQYRGFVKTLKAVYAEGGLPGCYRGMVVQLMRTVPNAAVTMFTYEIAVHTMHSCFL